ncbi:MAG: NAD(P)-dependent oxidoreductase [Pseudomonadota bacterium]
MVIGGNGHVGTWVLRELVEMGENPISYDIRPPSKHPTDILEKIDFIKGDVRDLHHLLHSIKQGKVDRIIHMVSLLTSASQRDPSGAYHINVGGTLNVLECSRIANIKRVAYSSSIAVYGNTYRGRPIKEDDHKDPLSFYGACKLFCEQLGLAYQNSFAVDFVAVRWPIVWGPGLEDYSDHGSKVFSEVVENALKGEGMDFFPGDQKYEILYVKDAAHSIILAVFAEGLKHRIFNAGCDRMIGIKELVAITRNCILEVPITVQERPDDTVMKWGSCLDIDRAKSELGYEPRFPPVQAVKDYMAYLGRENRTGE